MYAVRQQGPLLPAGKTSVFRRVLIPCQLYYRICPKWTSPGHWGSHSDKGPQRTSMCFGVHKIPKLCPLSLNSSDGHMATLASICIKIVRRPWWVRLQPFSNAGF